MPKLFSSPALTATLAPIIAWCALVSAPPARADFNTLSGAPADSTARWQTSRGETALRFDPSLLEAFGMTVTGSEAAHSSSLPGDHVLSITDRDGLEVWAPAAAYDGFIRGELSHRGALTLSYPGGAASLSDFSLRPASADRLELVTASGEALFELDYIHVMLYPREQRMRLWNMDVRISPLLAARLGQPEAAGMAIGQAFSSTALLIPQGAVIEGLCASPNWDDGVNFTTDVELFHIGSVQQVARESNVRVAIAPSATLRNVGTADVPWYPKFSTGAGGTYPPPYDRDQHPYLVWALYREVDGYFEQLASSELKHAFFATNVVCSCSGGNILWSAASSPNGLGCTDTYGIGTNDNPIHLGIRQELSALTGVWEQCGSMFAPGATPPGPCAQEVSGDTEDEFERRLVVAEQDLETTNANYWMEAWYVIRDDTKLFNGMAHVSLTPALGVSTWSFSPGVTIQGGAINEWLAPGETGPDRQHVRANSSDGYYSLAVKTANLGGGTFRYTYVLMAYDFSAGFDTLALDLPAGVTVSNLRFSDSDDNPANDWVATPVEDQLLWAASAGGALDWGRMATFSFEAEAQPNQGVVLLGVESSSEDLPVAILSPAPSDELLKDGFEDSAF